MTVECLVIRRSETVDVWVSEPNDRDRLVIRVWGYDVHIGSVPVRVRFRDDVRKQQVVFVAHERGQRRAYVRLWRSSNLHDAIFVWLVHRIANEFEKSPSGCRTLLSC